MPSATAAAPAPATETLLHVDPTLLRFGPNIRGDNLDIDPEFRESIREHGVLEVITCYRDDDDETLIVYRGNRRGWTAAELVAEDGEHLTWSTVPVRVIDRPADADRIVTQLTENHHRRPTTVADEAAAVEQLAAFGIPPADIARRLAVDERHVGTFVKVAAAPKARSTAAEFDLTIDQAAGLAEFEDDPKAGKALREAIDRGQFEHELERQRQARDDAAEVARITAELRKAKVKVVKDSRELQGYDSPAVRLAELQIEPDAHAECPGHCAWVGATWEYRDGRNQHAIGAVYWCRDAKANGHKKPRAQSTGPEKDEATKAKESAERKLVLAGNKMWRAAERVRRRWLHSEAAVKAPHPGAELFVLESLLSGDSSISQAMEWNHLWKVFRDVMGLDGNGERGSTSHEAKAELATIIGQVRTMPARRQLHLTALAILCAWEDLSGVHSWRNGTDPRTARVLTTMQAWGYPLTPVERRAAGLEVTDAEILGEALDEADGDGAGE